MVDIFVMVYLDWMAGELRVGMAGVGMVGVEMVGPYSRMTIQV